MNEETAKVQATRFLYHLFLCPRVAKVIVDKWMQQYVPLPVHTGAPRPMYDLPGSWIGAMIARVLLAPTDLTLTGFYNMTQSINNVHGSPQYVLSAWTPVSDFGFSVPLSLFDPDVNPAWCAEGMCRMAMYRNPEAHWNTRVEGPAMHSHAYFGSFKHIDLMHKIYFPPLFVMEILYWYIRRMKRLIPRDLHADACTFIVDMIRPLREYDRTQMPDTQQQLLDYCYQQLLKHSTSRDLLTCYAAIKQTRRVIQEYVVELYNEKADQLAKQMHPLNAPRLLALTQ